MGLRERKKEQTRRRIAETAHRLFGERGFERVTVAEVARAAEVAEATLFNYFPSKEALFYSGLEAFGARLVEAVRGRRAVPAFRAFLLAEGGQLERIAAGDVEALDAARTTARIIAASPALRAREREVLLGVAADLADALELPPPLAAAVANALLGAHLALVEWVRDRLLDGTRPENLAAEVRAHTAQVFALLESGLRDIGAAS